MCTTNENHMVYGSWDMERDRQNLLTFWTIFCPFTTEITQIIRILKKWKTSWDIIILHIFTINEYDILYGSCDVRHNFVSLLGTYYLFTPLTTRKIKILKKWKKYLEILSIDKLTQVYQKIVAATPPQKTPKFQKMKNGKNFWRYHHFTSFYTCVSRIMVTWYMVPDILRHGARQADGRTDGL